MKAKKRIAVFDSGAGGLTVVAEIRKLWPHADIVYVGDSANNPYGNRPLEELVALTRTMLRFLVRQQVDLFVIACNTLSAVVDDYKEGFAQPFLPIPRPVAKEVANMGLERVGVLATCVTINNGVYEREIHAVAPNVQVIGEGCPTLAKIIDDGAMEGPVLEAAAKQHMDNIQSRGPVSHVILGCTHYPLVMETFQRMYPDVSFIDPARAQALAVQEFVDMEAGKGGKGSSVICTTGDPAVFAKIIERLNMPPVDALLKVNLETDGLLAPDLRG